MSERLNEAIRLATEAHAAQRRKIDGSPYILHAMEAAVIVSTLTDDEDTVIAALLHDTAEDTSVTLPQLRQRFGDRVAALVAGETENKRPDRPAAETWKQRKEESLAVLRQTADRGIRMLWLADKLSNTRSLYRGWLREGDDVFRHFHQQNKQQQAWYYFAVADCLTEFADTAAYAEYTALIRQIFHHKGV